MSSPTYRPEGKKRPVVWCLKYKPNLFQQGYFVTHCFNVPYPKFSRALCSVLLTKYHSGDQVKKTEMGRTCGMYGGEERCI
jgi:hypothetical protein